MIQRQFLRAYYGPAAALQSTTLPPPLLPALIPSPGDRQDGAVNGVNANADEYEYNIFSLMT